MFPVVGHPSFLLVDTYFRVKIILGSTPNTTPTLTPHFTKATDDLACGP